MQVIWLDSEEHPKSLTTLDYIFREQINFTLYVVCKLVDYPGKSCDSFVCKLRNGTGYINVNNSLDAEV